MEKVSEIMNLHIYKQEQREYTPHQSKRHQLYRSTKHGIQSKRFIQYGMRGTLKGTTETDQALNRRMAESKKKTKN